MPGPRECCERGETMIVDMKKPRHASATYKSHPDRGECMAGYGSTPMLPCWGACVILEKYPFNKDPTIACEGHQEEMVGGDYRPEPFIPQSDDFERRKRDCLENLAACTRSGTETGHEQADLALIDQRRGHLEGVHESQPVVLIKNDELPHLDAGARVRIGAC